MKADSGLSIRKDNGLDAWLFYLALCNGSASTRSLVETFQRISSLAATNIAEYGALLGVSLDIQLPKSVPTVRI